MCSALARSLATLRPGASILAGNRVPGRGLMIEREGYMADTKASAEGDSPKRQGDKLTVGTEPAVAKGQAPATGDSPKHQGDTLEHALRKAAKK